MHLGTNQAKMRKPSKNPRTTMATMIRLSRAAIVRRLLPRRCWEAYRLYGHVKHALAIAKRLIRIED